MIGISEAEIKRWAIPCSSRAHYIKIPFMIWAGPKLVFLCIFGVALAASADDLHLSATDRILILAPHPDDEVLCCGGLIQQAVQVQAPIQVVFLTNGDYNRWSMTLYKHHPVFRPSAFLELGEIRRQEALSAAEALGITPKALVFLGYPDYGTLDIWEHHRGSAPAFENPHTRKSAVPYRTAYRPKAPYKAEEISGDIQAILQEFRPTKVFFPQKTDIMSDHRALYFFVDAALRTSKEIKPERYGYLVHAKGWPHPRGLHPGKTLIPPSGLKETAHWVTLPLTPEQENTKLRALQKHRTQYGSSRRFLTSFVRMNELFEQEPAYGAVERTP